MPTEVILPKVDMDMATGQISRWFVAEGAAVKQGDLLFEIETDKAAMEIDSPAEGIIRDITGKQGVDIAVGSPVAWIYAAGEAYAGGKAEPSTASQAEAGAAGGIPSSTDAHTISTASSQDAAAQTAPPVPFAADEAGAVRATPLARRLARENNIALSAVTGSGPRGRVVKADIEAALAASTSPSREVAPKARVGVRMK